MRKNGETNPGTIIFLVIVTAIGFYGFHVLPVYYGNLEVKEAVGEAFNAYFSSSEKVAQEGLMMRLNRNADVSHLEIDESGAESLKPGYGVSEDNVSFTFDQNTGQLAVRLTYDRIVEFKPLKKRKTYHFVVEKTGTKTK